MHFHPGFGRAAKGEAIDTADALRSWRWGDATMTASATTILIATLTTTGPCSARGGRRIGGPRREAGRSGCSTGPFRRISFPGIFDPERRRRPDERSDLAQSGNSICVNIVETYLLPTAYGGAGGAEVRARAADTIVVDDEDGDDDDCRRGSTSWGDDDRVDLAKRRAIDYSARVRAVADATRAMNKMRRMHADYPEHIYPDSLGVKAELNVWSKRAMLLGEERRRRDSFDRTGGLGGAGVVVSSDGVGGGDVIVVGDPAEMLRRLERQDASAVGQYDTYGGDGDGDGDGDLPYGPDAYTSRGCIERMEAILADAEAAYVSTRDERMRPSSDWYNHVLGAWARSDDVVEASRRTREILRGMEAYADAAAAAAADADAMGGDGRDDVRRMRYLASPDTVSYNIVLFCLARCGADATGRGGAREAESMFRGLEDRYRRTGDPTIRPDRVTYGLYCLALARAGLAPEAEAILDSLEDEQQRRDGEENDDDDGTRAAAAVVVPSLTIYNTVLNAWANSRRRDAPMRAESLLERMRILSSTGRNPGVEPDSISVSTVISCHARSRTRRGAERGERMLDDAIDMYSRGNSRVKPDSIMFNCAITGWTNISGVEVEQRGVSRHDIPAERAEALLRKMKDLRLEIEPCAHTYNHILDCVSFCNKISPYRCNLLSAVRPDRTFRRTGSHRFTSGQKVKSKDARIEQ
ncbi:hypothetical protein ACHAW5_006580 [Stephanodiscus triporus]|uniref:Uncharacterized protein n=1 Tax=Stephanodiscus triporus TaxID=2934178 RepID=A0ABD3R0W4_9STRA